MRVVQRERRELDVLCLVHVGNALAFSAGLPLTGFLKQSALPLWSELPMLMNIDLT